MRRVFVFNNIRRANVTVSSNQSKNQELIVPGPTLIVSLLYLALAVCAFFALGIVNAKFSLNLPWSSQPEEHPNLLHSAWAIGVLLLFVLCSWLMIHILKGRSGYSITQKGIYFTPVGAKDPVLVGWEHVKTFRTLDFHGRKLVRIELDGPLRRIANVPKFIGFISIPDDWILNPGLFIHASKKVPIEELERTITKYHSRS